MKVRVIFQGSSGGTYTYDAPDRTAVGDVLIAEGGFGPVEVVALGSDYDGPTKRAVPMGQTKLCPCCSGAGRVAV